MNDETKIKLAAMDAANQQCAIDGESPKYSEEDFMQLLEPSENQAGEELPPPELVKDMRQLELGEEIKKGDKFINNYGSIQHVFTYGMPLNGEHLAHYRKLEAELKTKPDPLEWAQEHFHSMEIIHGDEPPYVATWAHDENEIKYEVNRKGKWRRPIEANSFAELIQKGMKELEENA